MPDQPLLNRYPGKSYYNVLYPDMNGYWQFFGRVDLGNTWFFHAPVPLGTTEDNYDFAAYLHRAVGAEFSLEFQRLGFWDLRVAIAKNYRKGRVFIAGDAAHSHPPYGGYGINTGLEDARNLGWKLAAVLKMGAQDLLLDSYDEERRPVFESTARDFIEKSIDDDSAFLSAHDPIKDKLAFDQAWNKRANGASDEVGAFEPNYQGASIIFSEEGSPSALGSHDYTARPGHHLPPRQTNSGQSMAELLSPNFTLVLCAVSQQECESARDLVRELGSGITCLNLESGGEIADYGKRVILVRPDHFVAWAGDQIPSQDTLARAMGRDIKA